MGNYQLISLLLFVLLQKSFGEPPQLSNHLINLYGNASLGYYYANVYVGNPPQQQSVIIDTGSGQLAMPCSKCNSCGNQHIHDPFDLTRSATSKVITCASGESICRSSCGNLNTPTKSCTFSISYAEGSSISGIIVQDQIKFQQDSSGEGIVTAFGCTTRETNLFYTQAANGIFGLAPERNAKLLDRLFEKHSGYTDEKFQFSLCLSRNGGIMTVGGNSESLHIDKKSVKTHFGGQRNLYSLTGVGKIKVNNLVLRNQQDMGIYGLFIDSGSTFTYLPSRKYHQFVKQIENSCAIHSDRCKVAKGNTGKCFKLQVQEPFRKLKDVVVQTFPSFDIEINGETVKWGPQKYFLSRSSQKGQICLGIQSLDRYLLGANWMVDRDITFNLQERTVEIFSNSTCSFSSQQIQLAPMVGGPDSTLPLSYVAAVFTQNSGFFYTLVLFLLIVSFFCAVLWSLGRFFKQSPINASKQQIEQHNLRGQQQTNYEAQQSRDSSRQIIHESPSQIKADSLGRAKQSPNFSDRDSIPISDQVWQ